MTLQIQTPFSLRPLWISDLTPFRLPSRHVIHLPSWIVEGESFSRKIRELGYNAVIFATKTYKDAAPSRLSWDQVNAFLMTLRASSIKIGLKCEIRDYEEIKNFFDFDFFFCESEGNGFYEEIRKEIQLFEARCKKPLIYFLSCSNIHQAKRQSKWMVDLAHESRETTILAYPALGSTSFFPHPIFDELSKNHASSPMQLLPIFCRNKDSFSRISLEAYEDIVVREPQNRVSKLGICVDTLPEKGTFQELFLWIIGKSLEKPLLLRAYIEMWIQLHHPEAELKGAKVLLSSLFHIQGKIGELELSSNDLLKKKMVMLSLQIEEIETGLKCFSKCPESFQKELLQHIVDLKRQLEEMQYRRNKAS